MEDDDRRSSTGKLLLLAALPLATVAGFQGGGTVVHATAAHKSMNCATSPICTEVQDPESVFGEGNYVGHDEPSTLFYSNRAGSGNSNQWQLTLPSDPSPSAPLTVGKSYNFQLHPAFWFGMAICDTQSYPEQVSTCKADSNSNIVDPAISPKHPGAAFMEMQFYPPGWVSWPAGNSCDASKWCAALNIDSLSENAVTGQLLNSTCQSRVGVEYVNFAFITKSWAPQPSAPPNPVNSTINTFTPNPAADLFMNSGDKLSVDEHDTAGHFDICNDKHVAFGGSCTTTEGTGINTEPADGDDVGCFDKTASTLVKVSGCLGTNTGFDGVPYQPVWPDGNTRLHPTSIEFSSPLTNGHNFNRMAFEADLPRIEDPAVCDRFTGAGCTLIPTTDDLGPSGAPMPAAFYPFFSTTRAGGSCLWQIGNHIPRSLNDFGQNAQYGTLLNLTYTDVGGGPTTRYNDFRQILSTNPCPG